MGAYITGNEVIGLLSGTSTCGDSICDSGETCLADSCCAGTSYNTATQVCCSGSVYTEIVVLTLIVFHLNFV